MLKATAMIVNGGWQGDKNSIIKKSNQESGIMKKEECQIGYQI